MTTDEFAELQILHNIIAPYEDALDWIKWKDIKPEEHMTRDDLYRSYDAVRFANYTGHIFNVELTINWQCEGYDLPQHVDAAYRSFIERLRKFLSHRKLPQMYLSVFENASHVGIHSHTAIVVPRRYRTQLRHWIVNTLRNSDGYSFLRSNYFMRVHKPEHIVGQWNWFKYCFKGVNPILTGAERDELGDATTIHSLADLHYENGGIVPFRRVRVCRALGPYAQRNWGYVRPMLPAVQPHERYTDTEYCLGKADRQAEETDQSIRRLEII